MGPAKASVIASSGHGVGNGLVGRIVMALHDAAIAVEQLRRADALCIIKNIINNSNKLVKYRIPNRLFKIVSRGSCMVERLVRDGMTLPTALGRQPIKQPQGDWQDDFALIKSNHTRFDGRWPERLSGRAL
jgi:hypothetical protein